MSKYTRIYITNLLGEKLCTFHKFKFNWLSTKQICLWPMISFSFCRCLECENTEAYMRLVKVTSPIVIKFLVVSLIRIQYRLFLLIFKQENWLFTCKFVVYNSVLLPLVMYPVFSHVSCCFILFMLYVLYTCSIVSWSMHSWKKDNKSFTK